MKFIIDYPKNIGDFSTNRYYSGKHFSQRNQDKDFWHLLVLGALSEAKIPRSTFDVPVEIHFSFDDRLDCSNHSIIEKMIEDALKGWVIKDDTRRWVQRIVTEFNHEGKIIVEVYPMRYDFSERS